MLTELQERIARLVLESSPDPDLALAGGAALIVWGLVERTTIDLDFFTVGHDVENLHETVVQILRRAGLAVESQQISPTFARLLVSDGDDQSRVDLAQDARLLAAKRSSLGQTLSEDELAADKMLALFSRAEPRDYVDVYALAKRFDKERLCDLAQQKDPGFDETIFAEMLGAIARLEAAEFPVDDATLQSVKRFVTDWRNELERTR